MGEEKGERKGGSEGELFPLLTHRMKGRKVQWGSDQLPLISLGMKGKKIYEFFTISTPFCFVGRNLRSF